MVDQWIEVQTSIISLLRQNQLPVISAPTGTGKTTTQIVALLNNYRKIWVIVPTRIAAAATARYVNQKYRVTTRSCTSNMIKVFGLKNDQNIISYMTVGYFNKLIVGQKLRSVKSSLVDLIVLDEAHTFNEDYSIAFNICLSLWKQGQKVILTSATISIELLQKRFNLSLEEVSCFSIVNREIRRPFPVRKRYVIGLLDPLIQRMKNIDTTLDVVANTVVDELSPGKMKIVVLPGYSDIKKIMNRIKLMTIRTRHQVTLIHLQNEKDIPEDNNSSWNGSIILFATSGLVSSAITIPHLSTLYDVGIEKEEVTIIHENQIIQSLTPIISDIDQTKQRHGRVGRTCPGEVVCFYHQTELRSPTIEKNFPNYREKIALTILNENQHVVFERMGQEYQLKFNLRFCPTEDEIKKAFFMPFSFEQGLLVAHEEKNNLVRSYMFYILFLTASMSKNSSIVNYSIEESVEEQLFDTLNDAIKFYKSNVKHVLMFGLGRADSFLEKIYSESFITELNYSLKKWKRNHVSIHFM